MSDDSICFHCGQTTSKSSRINRLEDDRPCPTCSERVLNELPPALPGMGFFEESDSFVGVDEFELEDGDPPIGA